MDSEKLKTIMRERGITRAELARISGVNKRTIEGWFDTKHKTFNPSITDISKVSNALGVSLDAIVGGADLSESESFYAKFWRCKDLLEKIDKLDLKSVALINDIVEAFHRQREFLG